LVTVGAQEEMVMTSVVKRVSVPLAEAVGYGAADFSVAVTGQMVVLTVRSSVVTWPILAGQLVTVAAHEVTV